jgi:CheY-like chemotaxis protein
VFLIKAYLHARPEFGRIDVFPDAESALLALTRGAGAGEAPFDLLLLDLRLPGMSGVDLLKRLKDDPATQGLPIFVLTSSDRDRDRRECLDSGARLYLVKPLLDAGIEEILMTVRGKG